MLGFSIVIRASFSQTVRVRALFAAFAFFICLNAADTAQAQTMSSYRLESSGFTALSGATVQTLAGGTLDEGYFPLAPIGFNFKYNDVVYTQVSASTNGWMSFGTLVNPNNGRLNNLTTGGTRPLAAPLWDDLHLDAAASSVSYLTTGTAPNRVFTMQWLNMEWGIFADTPGISFQVKLYEGTNAVQFVYRQESGAIVGGGGASIGLAATGTGGGNFLSLSNSGTNPTASTTTETTNIGAKPATGQTYTFTPPVTTTAASVSISGRVTTASGRGIRNVHITLTDSNGNTRSAASATFGYYRFEDVAAGETYIISASANRYSFTQPTQVLNIIESVEGVNFIANQNEKISREKKRRDKN